MDETLDDLLSIFEGLDGIDDFRSLSSKQGNETLLMPTIRSRLEYGKSRSSNSLQDYSDTELEPSPKSKRPKLAGSSSLKEANLTHITVERNRRKQMNEHLSVLRSLMPCFYVKRGDQASIIGGVIDYINELQEILQNLEAKKQRQVVYSEVLSPRKVSSSPRPSPLSPRLNNLPISPRTPQPRLHQPGYNASSFEPSPSSSSSSNNSNSNVVNMINNELVANSISPMADVKVKFSGPNLLLKTVSPSIPGQALKIVTALEDLALETLHLNISTVEDAMVVNSFTIKIGIECQLSVEELAQRIQQTFC